MAGFVESRGWNSVAELLVELAQLLPRPPHHFEVPDNELIEEYTERYRATVSDVVRVWRAQGRL